MVYSKREKHFLNGEWGGGGGGQGELFISNTFDGGWRGGGGLIERWACLIWGFSYCLFK